MFDHGVSRAGGTVLKLTIVRTTVEAHDRSVSVAESEAGGARFVFRTGDRV